ncbi:MAG: conjugal transfer protein TrbD [Moraxellaceae bacterium]|jgi:type IV secretory pathway TrbD component|uniref:conjugal transfer protein TrbD n=1 Tax=Alkanindiges illinoisensis TaxID=197183 RepID=UPI00047966D4|nr:conjugal transfer protein TrbD [Alkanindiges illinoisensis]RZA08973.1 MAG: conjugal transfer protein TrbD [Moraxellaceae bacterium]
MSNETPLRRSTINRALTRPSLLLGCERELILMAGLIAAIMIFALKTWSSILFGVGIWVVALILLRRIASADPLASKVYLRQFKNQDIYLARSTPFRTE